MKHFSKNTCVQVGLALVLAFEPALVYAGPSKATRAPASAPVVAPIPKKPLDKSEMTKQLQETLQLLKKNREREPVAEVFRRVSRYLTPDQKYQFSSWLAEDMGTVEFPNFKLKGTTLTGSLRGSSMTAEFMFEDDVYVKFGKKVVSREDAEDSTRLADRLRVLFKHPREAAPTVDESLFRLLVPSAHAQFDMSSMITPAMMLFMFMMQRNQQQKAAEIAAQQQAAAAYAARCPTTQRCCQVGSSFVWHSNYCCDEKGGVPAIAANCNAAIGAANSTATPVSAPSQAPSSIPLPGQK